MELVKNIICALKYSRLNPRMAYQLYIKESLIVENIPLMRKLEAEPLVVSIDYIGTKITVNLTLK